MHAQGQAGTTSADPSVELELADGSRLVLDDANGSPIVCRIEGCEAGERISLADAMNLSGQPFAGFRLLGSRGGH